MALCDPDQIGYVIFDTAEENFTTGSERSETGVALSELDNGSPCSCSGSLLITALWKPYLYTFLKEPIKESFYLAVSRKFDSAECLTENHRSTGATDGKKKFIIGKHIYSNIEEHLNIDKGGAGFQTLQLISEDVSGKISKQLRKHYQCLGKIQR